MNKLKAIILTILVSSINIMAQNPVQICAGNNHNFGVPYTNGSTYNWKIQLNTSIASITSGNGTEHITMDLNNSGVFQLLVEEIDANGCSGYDSILVEILPLPNPFIYATGPTSFCEGDSVLLQVDSNYISQIWNNGSLLTFTYADTSGGYFINVTDNNGCSNNSNVIRVNVSPNPVADFIVDGICVQSPSTFVNTSFVDTGKITSSIWYMGNGYTMSGDSIKYTYTIGGSYFTQLFVTTDAGCIDSIGKFYTIYDIPKAAFTYNPFVISTLQPEMNFITTTPNITNAFWDFDDSTTSYMLNPVHEFNKAGFYDVMLMVEDTNQCIDSITQRITMYYDFVLHVPNAFTPDDDGLNDTFGPTGPHMENYLSYEFIVYNRWGEKVFATNNINEKWSGLNAQHGTYSWVVIITDEIGGVHKKEGSVTLIK